MTFLAFLGVALVVVLAGARVAYYGDALAEKRGWGRAWVGLILVAATTSLPELLTGTSAASRGLWTLPWATCWAVRFSTW
jgi:cation:H+ antiporter